MNHTFLVAVDWFFLLFHTVWTLFNIVGWIFPKTRKIHLVTMGLTAFSWFVLGLRYGIGFCVCTQWHWDVREMLGRPIQDYSYIHFLIRELTGLNLNARFVDVSVMTIFIIVVIFTAYVNLRDYLKSKKR